MAGKTTLLALVTIALLAWLAGCSSDSSNPVAVDTAPPAVPTDLNFNLEAGTVSLSWAPNTTDADFVGFKLSRTVNGTTMDLISNPQLLTSFVDPSPRPGINVYRLSAVDLNGNESAYATTFAVYERAHGFIMPIGD
jgi:hypothetical protein